MLFKATAFEYSRIRPAPSGCSTFSFGSMAYTFACPSPVKPRAIQSLIPPLTQSKAVWGLKTDIPEAAHFKSEVCSGFESVNDARGLNIGGWYDTTTEVGVDSASSRTAGVRL